MTNRMFDIASGSTVLFQGDSITDAGRDRSEMKPNLALALGTGYCCQIASRLLHDRPGDGLHFYNRGINGDRVPDLLARWQRDAIDLNPDIVNILVGVNDSWGFMDGRSDLTTFETAYRALLDTTKKQLPATQLILAEPFALLYGVVTEEFMPHLQARQRVVKQLANEYGIGFVPFQKPFDDALSLAPASYWTYDGIHPTAAGHQILADAWLRAICS